MWWTRERRRVIDVARRVEPRERCEGVQDERRFERTAKPCGPDAPTLAFKSRASVREATVTTKPGRRGERGISRNAITQGMPDASAEPVCSCAHPLPPLRTRPRVQRASGIPCALVKKGRTLARLGRVAPRERGGVYGRHAGAEMKEAAN